MQSRKLHPRTVEVGRSEQGEQDRFQQDDGVCVQQHRSAVKCEDMTPYERCQRAENSDEDGDTHHPNQTGQL